MGCNCFYNICIFVWNSNIIRLFNIYYKPKNKKAKKMKAWFYKTANSELHPLDDESLKRYAIGECFEFTFTKPRNAKFHARFFVFLNEIYNNVEGIQNDFSSLEHFRFALTIDAGYFDVVKSFHGNVFLKPRSIAFSEMDETTFHQFVNKIYQIVLNRLPGYCTYDLDEMVNRVLRFT